MALQGSIETADGVTHAQAYAKIVEINANWLDKYARAVVNVYHDLAARQARKQPIQQISFDFNSSAVEDVVVDDVVTTQGRKSFDEIFSVEELDEANPVAALYAYLETRQAFNGWTEV